MNNVNSIGLDAHKDTIAVAIAEYGRSGEFRFSERSRNMPASADIILTMHPIFLETEILTRRASSSRMSESTSCGIS